MDSYNKLDLKKLTNNKTFSKIVKPFFTDKRINNEKVLLMKEGEIISVDKKIYIGKTEKQNNFFTDAVKNVNIPQNEDLSVNNDHIADSIIKSIKNISIIKS